MGKCFMRLSLISAVLVAIFLTTVTIAQEPPKSSTDSTPSHASKNDQARPANDQNSSHRYHLRLGTVALNAGYISGPLWYPYGAYAYSPYYASAFWDSFWGPFGPYSYYPAADLAYGNGKGQVELKADPKNAEVYIDGAYAGTVQHLKNFWLDPGAYDVSISAAGRKPFQQRVYVLTGKTLNISAKLTAVNGTKEEKQ